MVPAGLCGILVIAAGLRFLCARNDLWLDEIWSLSSVRRISDVWQVFTSIHVDNNHYLNSLWMFVFRAHGDWIGFRVPAMVAGIGCVAMAAAIAGRKNQPAFWFATILAAFSYFQILYSSEARGYSEVLFFAFVCFYSLERWLEDGRTSRAVLYAFSASLGFAANLTFLSFYCAAVLWSAWRVSRFNLTPGKKILRMLACHGAPAIFLAWIYIIDIRKMVLGGGTLTTLSAAFAESLAWAFGGLPGNLAMEAATLTSAVMLGAGIWVLWRRRSDECLFYAAAIVVFPLLLVIGHRSSVIYVRYFIIGMGFLLILAALVLGEIWARGWEGRLVCLVFLAVYLTVNGRDSARLMEFGRGNYREAVRFMVQSTKGPVISIGSDHDYRVSFVLQFYVDLAMEDNSIQISGDKTVEYYDRNRWPAKGPEWFIEHRETWRGNPSAPGTFNDGAGNHYDLVKTIPSAPLSGLAWFIYHNARFQ